MTQLPKWRQSTGKYSHDACTFLHAMEQLSLITSAVLSQHILGYTRPLSVLLLSTTCDLMKAHTEVRNLVSVLAGIRNEEKIKTPNERAIEVTNTVDVKPSKPRTAIRQMHRANANTQSTSDCYWHVSPAKREHAYLRVCVGVCYIYIFFFYDSLILSGRDKHIFLFERLNHYPFLDNVIRWACCSVGRALHRNLRGQGFNSRTSLNFFFQVLFSLPLK